MTRRKYIPRPYAPLAMAHMGNVERGALLAKPGMGKTTMTLTFLDHLHNIWGESKPTLVLAPLRVARDTWANDSQKWEHLTDIDVVPIVGTPEQRAEALRKDAPVFTTNYDKLLRFRDHLNAMRRPLPLRLGSRVFMAFSLFG